MNPELRDEAVELGVQVARALEAAGGDELVQRAEVDPSSRAEVEPVLAALGVWDLDVRGDEVELQAAAVSCRAAGRWAVPYPVAERLSLRRSPSGDAVPGDAGSGDAASSTGEAEVIGLVVVDPAWPRAATVGLAGEWATVTLDGRRGRATPVPSDESVRKSIFVTDLAVAPVVDGIDSTKGSAEGRADAALGLVLSAWTLLGMLDRAIEVTCGYVRDRQQFGQPLSSFQSVQFQLTEAEVERVGVEELAKYALWSLSRSRVGGTPDQAMADALALRTAALEAAEVVFRVAHQLHGAIGFCDETTVSWLSRHSQPLRRLPFGLSATRQALVDELGARPLAGLFDADYARTELER